MKKRILSPIVGILSAFSFANAAIVTLEFSGTYNIDYEPVFGEEGPTVPYSFTITYDTELGSLLHKIQAGQKMGSYDTIHDWYGYSKDGIIATDLTFGTASWTVADIESQSLGGIQADLWFDVDLATATPTLSWIHFYDADGKGELNLGVASAGAYVRMWANSDIMDMYNFGAEARSSDMVITSVPEPSITALLSGTAVLAFLFLRRRGN